MTKVLEKAAEECITWAIGKFLNLKMSTGLNVSGQVLIDLAAKVGYQGELLFVDTGYHFPETVKLFSELDQRYPGITFRTLSAGSTIEDLYLSEPEKCCQINKIDPLQAYLADTSTDAILNARTRASSPTRKDLQMVEAGPTYRINPLTFWSQSDLETYLSVNKIPPHPLYELGFTSMGCWPCTRATKPGEDPRSGRFVGQGRLECGIWSKPTMAESGFVKENPK